MEDEGAGSMESNAAAAAGVMEDEDAEACGVPASLEELSNPFLVIWPTQKEPLLPAAVEAHPWALGVGW
eukprot:1161601-Pelagomonas_calceolata.AAC.9